MSSSELNPSQILFGTVWPPGGVTITLACFVALVATKYCLVFMHFRPIFLKKVDSKYTSGHFFSETISSKKFQPKFPIFRQSDGDATWWPNSFIENLTCG